MSALMRRGYAITRSYRNTFVLELAIGVIEILVYFFISRTFRHGATGGPPGGVFLSICGGGHHRDCCDC